MHRAVEAKPGKLNKGLPGFDLGIPSLGQGSYDLMREIALAGRGWQQQHP